MREVWSSSVARLLLEHTFLQARLYAITDFLTFITNLKARESDKTLVVRVDMFLSEYDLV